MRLPFSDTDTETTMSTDYRITPFAGLSGAVVTVTGTDAQGNSVTIRFNTSMLAPGAGVAVVHRIRYTEIDWPPREDRRLVLEMPLRDGYNGIEWELKRTDRGAEESQP